MVLTVSKPPHNHQERLPDLLAHLEALTADDRLRLHPHGGRGDAERLVFLFY